MEITYEWGVGVTAIFVAAIIVLFFYGWKNDKLRPVAPSLLTQIGIFGTFVGIAIALHGAGDPNDSRIITVEKLISGLSVSVWSSIAGIGLAVVLKIITRSKSGDDGQVETDSTDRIIETLKTIGQDISNAIGRLDNRTAERYRESRQEAADIQTSMQRVINTLEDEQGVVAREVREVRQAVLKLQTSSTEERAKIEAALNKFQETVAEKIVGELIVSLQKAFTEFNDKLAEHVGGNFQRLNEGIGQLLEWQNQYKSHVEGSAHTLKLAIASAQDAADKLKIVAEATSTIPGDMQALREAHGILTERARDMEDAARQMGEAGEHTIEQIRGIHPAVKAAAEAIETSRQTTSQILETVQELSEKQKSQFQIWQNAMSDLIKNAGDSFQKQLIEWQEKAQQAFEEYRSQSEERLRQHLDDVQRNYGEQTQQWLGEITQTGQSIETIATGVQERLQRSHEANEEAIRQWREEAAQRLGDILEQSFTSMNDVITEATTERIRDLAGILSGIFSRIRERLEELEGRGQ